MKPSNKVSAATLAAFIATILVYVLGEAGVDLPAAVEGAVVGLLTFGIGWIVPDADPT
jgi:hypothetical protein